MFEALSAECRGVGVGVGGGGGGGVGGWVGGGGGGGDQAHIIAANALASCVARSSAAILIVIYCG